MRRSRRRARIRRLRRRMAAMTLTLLTAGVVIIGLRHFGAAAFHAMSSRSVDWRQAEASRNRLLQANQEQIIFDAAARHPAYPYSLVPGGIQSGADLKRIAQRDPVIAAHYAGFDYDHARIVRLTLAKTVFLSYRVGNHVYWTRHPVTLHPGETLITDGRKSARTKCGNRVEEVPQQATSPVEPPLEKFDQPAHPATTETAPPPVFESSLFNRPGVPGVEAGPPSLITPGGWGGVPIFPPPFPGGLCEPEKKKGGGGGKGKKNPCVPVQPVPEPATIWLLVTGMLLTTWEIRRRRRASIPQPARG